MKKPGIEMRVKENDGAIRLRALIQHRRGTGLRKDKSTGANISADYVSDVVIEANDAIVG